MQDKKILLTLLPVVYPKIIPIGLGYLQAFLSKQNLDADILDINNIFYNLCGERLRKEWMISCNSNLEDNILPIIKSDFNKRYSQIKNIVSSFDIAGFSCFKSNMKTTLLFAEEIKSINPDIKLIFGGPEMARLYFKFGDDVIKVLRKIPDHIIIGEGETALAKIASGHSREKIIAFDQADDLKDQPFPIYRGVRFSDYPRNDAAPITASRGCVRRCNFCSERLLFKGFRVRPVSNIIEEIRFHKEINHIENFVFFDSMLNADLRSLEALCDEIIASFGSVNWEAQIAVRTDMSATLMKKMKRSGCYNLFIGLESGSDAVLQKMNKGFIGSDAIKFFTMLKNAELAFGISLIVGYPGETKEDFQKTLDFVISNKILISKIEQINPFTYYDGTIADEKADYKTNPEAMERMDSFMREAKRHEIKYTKAFIGNLVVKQ